MKMSELIKCLKKSEANCGSVDPEIRFIYVNEHGERIQLLMNDDVSFYTNKDDKTIDVEISIN